VAKLTQPHDKFLKALLDDPGALGALLRERLPPSLVLLLSDEAPELVDGVFLDQALQESRSDRLYRLRLKGRGNVYVHLLLEHKSRPEERAGLQVLGYMVDQWEREYVAGEKLTPILPLVIYNGAAPSRVPRSFSELMASHTASLGLRPLDFEVLLVDLGAIDDNALSNDPMLRAGLLALKCATRESQQRAKLRKVLEAVAEAPRLLRRALVYMIETYRSVDRAQLLGEASRVLPKEDVMTVAEELREEGRQEGAAGAQRAMLVRILTRRFGGLSNEVQRRVMAAGSPELELWLDRALDAATLDAVFPTPH